MLWLPFDARATVELRPLAEIRDRQLLHLRDLRGEESVLTEIKGFENIVNDYDMNVENRSTGVGVRITADRPIPRFMFWSIPETFCPEAYIDIPIEPGQEFTWTIAYEFYTFPPS